MHKKLFIVIDGPSGSGKSTLADFLAQGLQINLLSKDLLKEKLFDETSCERKTLGAAAFQELFRQTAKILVKDSIVIEAVFDAEEHAEPILELARNNDTRLVFIALQCGVEERKQRLIGRLGDRHPAHKGGAIDPNHIPHELIEAIEDTQELATIITPDFLVKTDEEHGKFYRDRILAALRDLRRTGC